jgi:hypothetical protein
MTMAKTRRLVSVTFGYRAQAMQWYQESYALVEVVLSHAANDYEFWYWVVEDEHDAKHED